MNKRQVIILWAIALGLGAAVATVKLGSKQAGDSSTQRTAGQTLFAKFPAESVAAIQIEGAEKSVSLAKKDGAWTIAQRDGYAANTRTVNELLRTIGELKVTQGMEAGPSFAPRFGMDESAAKAEDRGITATFNDASGKEIAKVTIGKRVEAGSSSPFGGGATGRFVRNHADESGFYAVSEMFPTLSDDPKRWLAEDFIKIEKIQSISVTKADSDEIAWKLTRETEDADFKLEGAAANESADPTATNPLKSLFSYARFEDVIPADKVGERAAAEGKRSVVITTIEGFTYNMTLTPAKPVEAPAEDDPENPMPPASDNFLLTVDVSAELPKERKKEEGESEEDAKTKDAAFTERLKTLTDRLAQEKTFSGRTFEISKFSVESLLKDRGAIVKKEAPAANGGANGGTGGTTAVTPPVAIPPLDQNEKE